MKIHKNSIYFALLCLCVLGLNGCAAARSAWQYSPWGTEDGAGFFKGLLDGFIAFWCLIISSFTSKVHVYEVKNIGFVYDFGFACGLIVFLGFIAGGSGGDDDGKSKETPPPDTGKPEDRPEQPRGKRRHLRIRGTRVNIPVPQFPWLN